MKVIFQNLLAAGVIAGAGALVLGAGAVRADQVFNDDVIVNGSLCVGFDPEIYTVPSIEDHANAMWTNKYLPAIGPTRNGPTNVNAKLTGMINELEHAHIYIDQLNSRVKELEAMVAELK